MCVEDVYLLSTIINSRNPATALGLSHKLLKAFEGLPGIEEATVRELAETGLSRMAAERIKAALKLGTKLFTIRHGNQRGIKSMVGAKEVYRRYGAKMRGLKQEVFRVILLSAASHVIRDVTVGMGTLTTVAVDPALVFRPAIRWAAAALVLLHNHPGGEANPSEEDREVTEQMVAAGELIGIKVMDHVIIGEDGYFSFRDEGLI